MKPAPELIDTRKIARRLGVDPKTVRRWAETRQDGWPRPHAAAGSLLFYLASDVDHYITHGRWPDHMKQGG